MSISVAPVLQRLTFPPWTGELGWEVMTWAPWCRARCVERGMRGHATSFAGMAALYEDFADFSEHPTPMTRSDTFQPKRYRARSNERLYRRYGKCREEWRGFIAIHARGIRRKANYNYHCWDEILALWPEDIPIVWLGSPEDGAPPPRERIELIDRRGAPLAETMDWLASARCLVGVSSGIMHLGALCGIPLVVWGYGKTHFGETLEQRYKETWNPFGVPVVWIRADDWQPEPIKIVNTVQEIIHGAL